MSTRTNTSLTKIKRYPIPVCSLIVCLILVCFIYLRGGHIEARQADAEKYSSEAALQRSNMSNAASLQDQLAYLVKANDAVRERALAVDGLGQDIQYFYPLAAEAGVKYLREPSAGQKQAVPKGAAYVPLAYTIDVQGSFPQVLAYLKYLEQGLYFCRINSVVLSGGESDVTLNLNVDFLGIQKGAVQ